jgi:hypothetical protein
MSLDVTDSNARFIDDAGIGYAVDGEGCAGRISSVRRAATAA